MNRELQVSIHRGERLNAPGKDRASVPGEFEWGLAFGKNTVWGRFPLLDVRGRGLRFLEQSGAGGRGSVGGFAAGIGVPQALKMWPFPGK